MQSQSSRFNLPLTTKTGIRPLPTCENPTAVALCFGLPRVCGWHSAHACVLSWLASCSTRSREERTGRELLLDLVTHSLSLPPIEQIDLGGIKLAFWLLGKVGHPKKNTTQMARSGALRMRTCCLMTLLVDKQFKVQVRAQSVRHLARGRSMSRTRQPVPFVPTLPPASQPFLICLGYMQKKTISTARDGARTVKVRQ